MLNEILKIFIQYTSSECHTWIIGPLIFDKSLDVVIKVVNKRFYFYILPTQYYPPLDRLCAIVTCNNSKEKEKKISSVNITWLMIILQQINSRTFLFFIVLY